METTTTPESVLEELKHLGDVSSYAYLEAAFAELQDPDREIDESMTELVEEIATLLIDHVYLDDLLAIYAERCLIGSRRNPLAEAFMVRVLARSADADPHTTLRAVIDLRVVDHERGRKSLLFLMGTYSAAVTLSRLLDDHLTSELTSNEFDTLFSANDELNQSGRRPTRANYLQTLLRRVLPEGEALSVALMLSNEWHGNVQSLIDTSLELNLAPATL
jgi:hypothetical protein